MRELASKHGCAPITIHRIVHNRRAVDLERLSIQNARQKAREQREYENKIVAARWRDISFKRRGKTHPSFSLPAGRPQKYPTEQSIWANIKITQNITDCWPWTGSTHKQSGFGRLYWQGRARLVHQVIWELTQPTARHGLRVLHRCHNPLCCNPDHLLPTSQRKSGSKRKIRCEISHDKAELIVQNVRAGITTIDYEAELHNVSKTLIEKLVAGYMPYPRIMKVQALALKLVLTQPSDEPLNTRWDYKHSPT